LPEALLLAVTGRLVEDDLPDLVRQIRLAGDDPARGIMRIAIGCPVTLFA